MPRIERDMITTMYSNNEVVEEVFFYSEGRKSSTLYIVAHPEGMTFDEIRNHIGIDQQRWDLFGGRIESQKSRAMKFIEYTD